MYGWVLTLYQGCHMLLFPVLVSHTNLWWVTVQLASLPRLSQHLTAHEAEGAVQQVLLSQVGGQTSDQTQPNVFC